MTKDPFRPPDDEARLQARRLIGEARHGALGVLKDGAPMVTRIALVPEQGSILTLVSDLAPHTSALREAAEASLLVGEPGKGDPLAHPRITVQVRAAFLQKTDEIVRSYLTLQPKAHLYIGFADFHLVCLTPVRAVFNAGFGNAYRLTAEDLTGRDTR